MLIRDLSASSFHQSDAINKRKAQETTSSVRLLAVTISTVLSIHNILTPGTTDSLSLLRFLTFFLAKKKAKENLSSKTFDCLLPSPGDERCHSFQPRVFRRVIS